MAKSKADYWKSKDGLVLLEGWARDGLTNEQIAHNIGITAKTLYEWLNKYCEISDSLKKGKEVVDFEVENALLKRALGYTITIREEKLDKYGDVHELEREVHIPADVTAQIFWLKNRKSKVWREKQEVVDTTDKAKKVIIVNDCK